MQARYYDPVIGRFYSNDPVGFVFNNLHSFGRYTYANNNPFRFIDPDGRYSEEANMWANALGFDDHVQATDAIRAGAKNSLESARTATVNGLRAGAQGADMVSKGSLVVAAGGAMIGQLQVAAPAATASATAGAASVVLDAAADLLEHGNVSGETIQSSTPMAAGALTETAMKAINITSKISKPVAIGVEVVGTVAETVGDYVENHESKEN
jgi:hypothetical protein